mgnify:CR=1 FL=1
MLLLVMLLVSRVRVCVAGVAAEATSQAAQMAKRAGSSKAGSSKAGSAKRAPARARRRSR